MQIYKYDRDSTKNFTTSGHQLIFSSGHENYWHLGGHDHTGAGWGSARAAQNGMHDPPYAALCTLAAVSVQSTAGLGPREWPEITYGTGSFLDLDEEHCCGFHTSPAMEDEPWPHMAPSKNFGALVPNDSNSSLRPKRLPTPHSSAPPCSGSTAPPPLKLPRIS